MRNFGCHNIDDLKRAARRRLPLGVWEYLQRGVEDEAGMVHNRAAFEAITFRPHVLRDVSSVDTSATLVGGPSALPLAVAPTGGAGTMAYQGDLALAKAAAKAGVPFTISSASTMNLEEIAVAGGRLWFQLYMWERRELSMEVVDRAAETCEALFVTLDMAVPPNREYLLRNGFGTPFRLNATNMLDILSHPRWLFGVMGRYALSGGIPAQANLPEKYRTRITGKALPGMLFKQDDLVWDDIAKMRDRWPGKLVLKGILRPDDAQRAVEIGADAIVVSNHGGRSLDSSMAALNALPSIVEAVGGKMELLLDSGIRRGSDIVKAVALGAQGVLTGRAMLYGLAVGGEEGVCRALELLRKEAERTMALLGVTSVSEIDRDLLGRVSRSQSSAHNP